jgi:hypothetical protein
MTSLRIRLRHRHQRISLCDGPNVDPLTSSPTADSATVILMSRVLFCLISAEFFSNSRQLSTPGVIPRFKVNITAVGHLEARHAYS